MRRASSLATVLTLLTLSACSAGPERNGSGPATASPPSVTTSPSASPSASPSPSPSTSGPAKPGEPEVLVKGRRVTWGLAFLPDRTALVTERESANVLAVSPNGQHTKVFAKIPGVVAQGEGGLLGIAVSPGFATDKSIYLYLTAESDNRIVRILDDGRGAPPQTLVTGIPKAGNHNGGRLAFGPDKMLYASTGDAGRQEHSQDRKSLGGKILRMTPEGKPAPGNPFGTLVWTYGHRNVQGMAWDGAGRMYATEFGQNTFDEINLIEKGANYGWPEVEGTGGKEQYTDPLLTWTTAEASPSGLAYAGGSLWAAALRGQRLWQVPLDDGKAGKPVAHFQGRFGRIRSATLTPDGDALWLTTDKGEDDGVIEVPLS